MFQKKILSCLVFALLLTLVFGQVATSPNDPLYDDILIWENLLLIPNQSPVRPYPLATIKTILDRVIASSNSLQASIAEAHYQRIFGKPLSFSLGYEPRFKFSDTGERLVQQNILPAVEGDLYVTEKTTMSFDLGFHVIDNYEASYSKQFTNDSILPFFSRPKHDAPDDPAELGSFSALTNMNMNLAYSGEKWYMQGGMSRLSFGPFHTESVTLSSEGYHSGNLIFYYNADDLWTYQQSFLIIGSTNHLGKDLGGEKYFHLHSLEYNPFPWLSLSYFESMVYGGTFDPMYFLPLPFMVAQGIGSFGGNLQMGLGFKIRPTKGLLWAGELLVDDVSANDLLKLKFDTKLKLAGITGLQYAFDNPVFKSLSLNYSLVAPYMYTHRDDWYAEGKMTERNFQNYTNNGYLMGSELLPNSDRVALQLSMTPVQNLNLDLRFSFSRHANTNESIPIENAINYLKNYDSEDPKVPITDGGIYNFAVDGEKYMDYAQTNFMFMAQKSIMSIVRTGFDASYKLPLSSLGTWGKKAGSLSAKLSYDFEYIHNNGVQNEMFARKETSDEWNGFSDDEKKAKVEEYRSEWRSKLYDSFAHYLSFSIIYRF